jgi:hypothetical protein
MKAADGIEMCNDTLPLFQEDINGSSKYPFSEDGKRVAIDFLLQGYERDEEITGTVIEELRRGAEFVRAPTPAEKIEDLARELLLAGYGVTEAWRVAKAFYEEAP